MAHEEFLKKYKETQPVVAICYDLIKLCLLMICRPKALFNP